MNKENAFERTSFTIDGWTLYSYTNPPQELHNAPSALEETKSDSELIAEGSPLFRVVAQKQMNHLYRVYHDYRFGDVNRRILMCDSECMDVDACGGDIGKLMAFAEHLDRNEQFGVFSVLKDRWLAVRTESEHCINCPYNALPAEKVKDEKSLFETLGRSVYSVYEKHSFSGVPLGEVAEAVVHALLLRTLGADKLRGTGEFLWDCIRYEAVNADDVRRVADAAGLPEETVQRLLLADFHAHNLTGAPLPDGWKDWNV